jgi:diphosphoinositol-polyphosphate diphosphatase
VSSSKYPERWIVPGGGVEQDETNAETAVRELLEEAGVVGRLGRCLGVFEVNNTVKLLLSASLFKNKSQSSF